MGLLAIVLALRTRLPVAIAWSTPGAALLATAGVPDGGFATAVAAFLLCGVLLVLAGLWPWLGRTIDRIPRALAAAMLAGVLLPLCLEPFKAVESAPELALPVIATWALLLRFARTWAVPACMVGGRGRRGDQPAAGPRPRLGPGAGPGAHRPRLPPRPGAGAGRAAVRGDDGLAERDRHGRPGQLRLPPALAHDADLDRRRHARQRAVRRPRGQPGGHHRRARGRAGGPPRPGPALGRGRRRRRRPTWSSGSAPRRPRRSWPPPRPRSWPRWPAWRCWRRWGSALATAIGESEHREAALITFVVSASGVTLLSVTAAAWGLVAGLAFLALQRWTVRPASPPPSPATDAPRTATRT